MKLNKNFFKSSFFLASIFLIVLSIPHFYQRYFDRDEGVYAAVSTSMFEGKTLYKDIWDHKPPLIYILYSPVALLGVPTGMFILKLIVIIIKIFTLYLFYRVLIKFNIRKSFYFPILLFLTFLLASPIFQGNTINVEVFFLPVTTLFILRILNKNFSYFEGFLLFLAFVIKFQAFAEIVAISTVFLLLTFLSEKRLKITKVCKFLLAFIIPLCFLVGVASYAGNLNEMIFSLLTVNFGYVDQSNYLVSIGNIVFSRSILIVGIFTLLTSVLYFIYFFKNKKFNISTRAFTILNIVLIEGFLVLYPQRNYGHYLLQLIPAILFIIIFLIYLLRKYSVIWVRFISVFISAIIIGGFFTLFTISDLAQLKPINSFPIANYYYKFLFENPNSPSSIYFSSDNAIENAAKYLKENYAGYERYYFYVADPWIINLSGLPYVNKYTYYLQMYFSDQMFLEEKGVMLSANVIFFDNTTVISPSLMSAIESSFLLEEIYENYNIYIKK